MQNLSLLFAACSLVMVSACAETDEQLEETGDDVAFGVTVPAMWSAKLTGHVVMDHTMGAGESALDPCSWKTKEITTARIVVETTKACVVGSAVGVAITLVTASGTLGSSLALAPAAAKAGCLLGAQTGALLDLAAEGVTRYVAWACKDPNSTVSKWRRSMVSLYTPNRQAEFTYKVCSKEGMVNRVPRWGATGRGDYGACHWDSIVWDCNHYVGQCTKLATCGMGNGHFNRCE